MINKKAKKQVFSHYNFLGKNSKAQGMSTSTIILLILGIVVLVVLILGFTMGWSRLAPWLSSTNVDTIVTACGASCATNSVYDYCLKPRELKADNEKLKDVTCNYLSKNQTKYGVEKCSQISCSNILFFDLYGGEVFDKSMCSGYEGKILQALVGDTLITYYECETELN